MTPFCLQHGDRIVRYESESGGLSITDAGCRAPWLVDLSETARIEVRPRGSRTTRVYPVALGDLVLRHLGPCHLQWVGTIGGAECAFEIELEGRHLVFTVTPLGSTEAELVSAVWPGAISFADDHREVCWSNYHQGALFRADGHPWQTEVDVGHVAMRVCGLTSADASLALIAETAADTRWHFADDGQHTMCVRAESRPSMGSLAYARKLRLVPLRKPGYVEIAQAFRAYAQRQGLWVSWEERVARNPHVDKLRGAFVACAGYWFDAGADQVGVMRKMHDYGFARGYLFSPKMVVQDDAWHAGLGAEPNRLTDAQLAAIQSLGYLTAPFLQVEEVGESFLGGRYLACGPDGQKIRRWQMGERSIYELAKWQVLAALPRYDDQFLTALGVHFDTLTAMALVEHHGLRSYDRRGDIALRLQVAGYYRSRGKVIVSEGLRDWSVHVVDLGTSKSFCPIDTADRRVWTAPLSDLVYHDSCVRTTWEHHPYDDDRCIHSLLERRYHPFGAHLTDLLTCSPPVLFPEGMLYGSEHREVVRENGEAELETVPGVTTYCKRFTDEATQVALPVALEACRLHERHGVARMLSHRFPDDGYRFLQESEFSSGLHVTVNFGDADYTLPDGRTVLARSALVDE